MLEVTERAEVYNAIVSGQKRHLVLDRVVVLIAG